MIDLKYGSKLFKLALYQSVPAAHQIKAFEFEKQSDVDVIELSVSSWDAPVTLFPVKDGQQSFKSTNVS